jgi:hypothetical protein
MEIGYAEKIRARFSKDASPSTFVERALNTLASCSANWDTLEELLKFLRHRTYLKNRGLMTIRIPHDLREWISKDLTRIEDDLVEFGCWATRLTLHSRALQESIQQRLKSLLRSGRHEIGLNGQGLLRWPPSNWSSLLDKAALSISSAASSEVATFFLPKEHLRELRNLRSHSKNHSDEVIAVAMLIWRRKKEEDL